MKYLVITFSIIMSLIPINTDLKDFDYDKAWAAVDEDVRYRNNKSALEKTKQILAEAEKEKNEPQIAKCLVYMGRLIPQTDEDGIGQVIQLYEQKIQSFQAPLKHIMASYLADIYKFYFNINRWKIADRSILADTDQPDFRTWDSQQFLRKIEYWYLYSIQDKSAVDVPVDVYKPIMQGLDENGIVYRPTVYEVLVDRVFSFIYNYKDYIVANGEGFEVDEAWYFDDSEIFINKKINDKDTSVTPYKVLSLYQQVLKASANAGKHVKAEFDARRLGYVHQQSTLENKDALYIKALEALADKYQDIDYAAEIINTLAMQILNDNSLKAPKVEAIKILETAIKKYPESFGARLCMQNVHQIKKPEILLAAESIYPADKAMLFAFDHKNIQEVNIRIYKFPDNFKGSNNRMSHEDYSEYFNQNKPESSSSLKLNMSATYDSQKTEWSHTGLKVGTYAMVVASKGDDPVSQFVVFDVSNLAYTTYLKGTTRTFVVTDRVSGAPVNGASLELYQEKYDNKARKYELIPIGTYKTNKDGIVKYAGSQNTSFKVRIKKDKDVLDHERYYYNFKDYDPEPYKYAEFYTDRAIYRPGQTVYYKAILLQQDSKSVPSLIKNKTISIQFSDANQQVISRIDQKSNAFGSVNGSFVIPEGRMTGGYSIQVGNNEGITGSKWFRVEEYKRPTFEVKAEAPKEATQLNKEVTVTGNAVSLAGVAIDNAQVTYKVTRMTTYPFWRCWWYFPNTNETFILKQGDLTTDNEGNFNISFMALPDLKAKKSDNPRFTYRIEGDVTDIQGETRSFSTYLTAGYTAFQLIAEMPQQQDVRDLKMMKIKAMGSSGQELNVNGSFEIHKLKEPSTVKIHKYWQGTPDQPIRSSDYNKLFPHYPVGSVNDFDKWETEKVILKSGFDTNIETDLKGKLKAGVYKIVTKAKDQEGNDVEGADYTVITDFGKKQFPNSDFLFMRQNAESYQPGDVFELDLGTPDKKVYVHVVLEKDRKVLSTHNILVDKTGKVALPITENYRGGFSYQLFYIKENRWYSESQYIPVPWTNKELMVTYETFRDKTLPGSKEQYKIKISGMNKEKVMAEVLAAMYDASLDQFTSQYWRKDFYPGSYMRSNPETAGFELKRGGYLKYAQSFEFNRDQVVFPYLIGLDPYNSDIIAMNRSTSQSYYTREGRYDNEIMMKNEDDNARHHASMPAPAVMAEASLDQDKSSQSANEAGGGQLTPEEPIIQPRTNLKETVFFYPDIKTDADGNLVLSFTMNEALTKWKLMLMAHTEDMQVGFDSRYVQTQKELMVLPNAPRFVRDGDIASINAKVSNLSEQSLSGKATLQIWDAVSMKDITSELIVSQVEVPFDVVKGKSEGITWQISVPDTKYNAITYRVSAVSKEHTDAEENTIPVITNRILITETMPFWVPANATRTFRFNAFNSNQSVTKKDFRYTFEYTANPVWYAIQALPYIQETNNASTQALIDRMYANVLAASIANAHPKIKAVFDQWQIKDKDALISNLSRNQELKTALIEETPWVREALSESEQKRNIATLFDLNRLGNEKVTTIQKLRERQLPNGGFPWIEGGIDNIYTTQLIMENIGHLLQLGAMDMHDPDWSDIIAASLEYMDESLDTRYKKLKENIKKSGGNIHDDHLDYTSIQYLYVKSFFSHVKPLPVANEAIDYYMGQAQKYWTKRNLYAQAMIGLIMIRKQDKTGEKIVRSLRERSFQSEEMGMYWNEGNGYYWYQLPIERHAMLIELFTEADAKKGELDRMKMWLLKNKQTNHWKTSKSTATAIYALLIQGEGNSINSWVTESTEPVIMVGKELLNTSTQATESGTGYIKKAWSESAINKDQGTIKVTNNNKLVSWGAAYYQYFEHLDKVRTFADTPLKLHKKIYKVERTNKGDLLVAVTDKSVLKPGDKLQVRIELVVDRDMEYVHMKDMRASGLEPMNVLSTYKYQGGLGYYEATKDLGTHFYFDYLPKGTFVFEYPLRVVHKGDFSAGITTIECMYAPEFSSHSEGIRIKVE